MKLLTYRFAGRESFGVVRGDQVIDGPALFNEPIVSLKHLLELDLTDELRRRLPDAQASHPLADIEYLPPITDPAKIFCVGVNYQDHRDETGTTAKPDHPTIFTRFADTHVGHQQPIRHPANTSQLDYEGEVALVIGRTLATGASDAELAAGIAGLSCYNDVSARDWQLHNSQWIPGKNFEGVGSFGPWLVTLDEYDDLGGVALTTRVNGEVLQHATLDDLIFDFVDILRYLTGFTTLAAGDVIVTGTPGGVGLVADPPRFLQPGDTTEVEVDGVGILRNSICEPTS
ncbi:fumarylacetoacetate hydrolase family protein [Mycolicibacterium sp. CBM1]